MRHTTRDWFLIPFLALIIAGSGITAAKAADLDATQQKYLDAAKSELKKFQDNLKLAQDAAGPGTAKPTGSKARLAATRLSSALQSQANTQAYLERLPADNADVKSLTETLEKTSAEADALKARLTGQAEESPPAKGMKLDYRQGQALKNATFNVRKVEGFAAALEQLVETVNATQDKTSLDHAELQKGMNTIDAARREAGFAQAQLDKLPADGTGVAEVADSLKAALASIDNSEASLKPVHAEVMKLIDPASHGDVEADLARLTEMAQSYGHVEFFQTDRPQAAILAGEIAAAKEELKQLTSKYAALTQQETDLSRQLTGKMNFLSQRLDSFAARAAQEAESLPQQIDDDLKKVNELADTAVKESRPAYFTGGIPQHMGFAEEKVALLAVLSPESAADSEQKLDSTRQALKDRQASLIDAIIASTEMPADKYAGPDADDLKRRASDAIKTNTPDAEILAVAIPSENWKRETLWRSQRFGEWYKIDRSKLQAQVIVRQDDKVAVIQPVDLWMNHISNDELTANPLFEKDEAISPQFMILMAKVK